MNHNTEQELIDNCNAQGASFTTITDVINWITNENNMSEEEAKTHLRDTFSNVSDWSF